MTGSKPNGRLIIGNAPLSWGVFEGDADTNPDWGTVLDEIVEAGYRHLELGPIGFLPEDIDVLGRALQERGLSLLAGFVYEDFHDPSQRDKVLDNARRTGSMLAPLGAHYMVIIDRMSPERQRTAARSEAASRLSPGVWSGMIDLIGEVADLATEEFGLRPVLHPHCATYIEFDDEIDRALADLPQGAVGLCVDTAHSTVAGLEAAELVDRYSERVEYFHLKDVDAEGFRRMQDEHLTFDEALGAGLFCPIGDGIVEWTRLSETLERIGFVGAATVEQDPDPSLDLRDFSGLEAARASMNFLRRVGLAQEEGS